MMSGIRSTLLVCGILLQTACFISNTLEAMLLVACGVVQSLVGSGSLLVGTYGSHHCSPSLSKRTISAFFFSYAHLA